MKSRVAALSLLMITLAMLIAAVGPASADIKEPNWTATPLPASIDQNGTVAVTGSGCGPSGQLILSDRFDTEGDPATTDTGQSWVSDSSGTWQITDEALVYTSEDANLGYLVVDAGTPDARMSFTVDRQSDSYWAVFRYRDPLNHYRFGRDHGGSYKFEKVENGVVQGFAPFSSDIVPRAGDHIDITYEADDSINIYRDNDWLYGDGLLFNIAEPMIGFATGDTTLDAQGSAIEISSLQVAPFSGTAVTASVVVAARSAGIDLVSTNLSPDNNGNWTGRLAIPDDNGTGNYEISAICSTPGYQITYPSLNAHVSFEGSEEAITDLSASVDFDRVEKSGTFDPVTKAVIASLLIAALGVAGLGAIAARRLGDDDGTK